MIVMLVAAEDQPNVAHPEAEALDIGCDQWRGPLRAAVDQDMAARACHEDRADPARADIISAAMNSRRRGGVVPAVLALARLGERGAVRLRLQRSEQNREASEQSWLH